MELADMDLREYLDMLKSKAPAPGGGAAAAISGAQGAALVLMVCELTIGKEKFRDYEKNCKAVAKNMEKIYSDLLICADEDTAAFNKVAEAFKMPKETEVEKSNRSKAVGNAIIEATEIPFKIMKLGVEGLRLTEKILGKSNTNASSDIGAGALNLKASVLSAWLNVKINLPSIKDDSLRKVFKEQGEKIVFETISLAEKCYKGVMDEL